MPVTASRSCVVANRQPIVCRAVSAVRFHLRHVGRFSPTTLMTYRPHWSIKSKGTSSARSNGGVTSFVSTSRAQVVASRPSTAAARCRHCSVNSAKERPVLSGRVASVACWRRRCSVSGAGCLPCFAVYSAINLSVSASMLTDRDENSVINSSGTPTTAQAGLWVGPRSRCSH